MKVLVIGGAGYIGSHVARALLDAGDEVTVFDNLSSGAAENLFPEAAFVKGDILDYGGLVSTMRAGIDALVHLAAFKAAGESMVVPEKYSLNNIAGSINVFNAALETGVRRIVFSSSAAVYGEPEYNPIDERHPCHPVNFYGYAKFQIEGILAWYFKLRGLSSLSLRYFNAAGYDPQGRIKSLEKNPANLLPVIMETAAGLRDKLCVFGTDYPTPDGTCIRDYIHVSDLADAHVLALRRLEEREECLAVNLGTGRGVSVLEMLAAARRVTGRAIGSENSPRRPGDPAVLIASFDLARRLLGWRARLSDVTTLVESAWRAYERSERA
jgi:UDP-glucose 4-epimerase